MKTKLAQLVYSFSRIDRQYIQFAYFALVFVAVLFTQKPSDGGTGPY